MTQLVTRITGVATLAAVSVLAAAAQAQPSVRVGDLNLATVAGKATFDHRVNVAADQVCGDERNFSIRGACEAAVRSEVSEKLAAISPSTQFAAAPTTHAQRTIRIVDLNLATAAGKATFAQRVSKRGPVGFEDAKFHGALLNQSIRRKRPLTQRRKSRSELTPGFQAPAARCHEKRCQSLPSKRSLDVARG